MAATSSTTSFQSDEIHSTSIPIIDFSELICDDDDQRSKAIHDLRQACQEWGFFILVNHGIPESLEKALFAAAREFVYLPEADKKQYESNHVLDPIQCGNFNFANASNQSSPTGWWRDYLKLTVHPQFHCPSQPQYLREIVKDYSERSHKLARKIMDAMSTALELDPQYVAQTLKLDSCFQQLAINFYPPCPYPDEAIGLPIHTDPNLFTFLIHNGVAGLQLEHNGKWISVDSPENSIAVNIADQLQIFSNGRFKSVKHRATVNAKKERISIVGVNGPSLDVIVGPAAPIVERDGAAFYHSISYEEYRVTQREKSIAHVKPLLDQLMIQKT